MPGFKFSTGKVDIEIEGKKYPVNWGDPVIQQKILAFSVKLMSTKLSTLDEGMLVWVSETVHEYIAELLGAESEAEIFADREASLMDELRLFTYIQEQVSKDKRLADLDVALGRYAAGETL